MVDALTPEEMRRAEIILPCWALCKEPLDQNGVRFVLRAVRKLTDEQLRAACEWVAAHPIRPGQTTLRAVMDAVDPATRAEARKDRGETLWAVPPLPGVTEAEIAQFKRPAGYQWSDEELQLIRDAIFGERRESWLTRQRQKFPPLEPDPIRYGPPPDERFHAEPLPERKRQLASQLKAKLAHLARIGAGPQPVFGLASVGAIARRREPGEDQEFA